MNIIKNIIFIVWVITSSTTNAQTLTSSPTSVDKPLENLIRPFYEALNVAQPDKWTPFVYGYLDHPNGIFVPACSVNLVRRGQWIHYHTIQLSKVNDPVTRYLVIYSFDGSNPATPPQNVDVRALHAASFGKATNITTVPAPIHAPKVDMWVQDGDGKLRVLLGTEIPPHTWAETSFKDFRPVGTWVASIAEAEGKLREQLESNTTIVNEATLKFEEAMKEMKAAVDKIKSTEKR
ncbi:MAG: hypothetical protein JNM99_17585 [Verrucomicrobiaceae bacterium]|nr:hypothetical protein [Verrucomicrobiaceae bacterium]